MTNLMIIGARGFGREIFHLALKCCGFQSDYLIGGFLDDKSDALMEFSGYPQIVSSVEAYEVKKDDLFICALGDPKQKKLYVEQILNKGGRFAYLDHPAATIAVPANSLPQGTIIQACAFISCDVAIGEFVSIQPFCTIGHDASIGSYAQLNAYAFMGGYAEIGEGVTLHTGAKVLPHKKVGPWSTVGAGSLVIQNVKSEKTVFGMPAMPI